MSDISIFSPCALHIPHKRWAYETDAPNPQLEEDNYRYLEAWSKTLKSIQATGGAPPIYPNLVFQVYENVT
jgi:hypothetical protein